MGVLKKVILTSLALLVFCQLSSVNSYNQVYPPAVYGNNVNVHSNNSHHMVLGYMSPGIDRLLLRQVLKQNSSFMRVKSENLQFPPNRTVNIFTITAIRAIDQDIKGNGGFASLLSGGVGYKNVTIHVKSQRSYGYNFIVEIYGRYIM